MNNIVIGISSCDELVNGVKFRFWYIDHEVFFAARWTPKETIDELTHLLEVGIELNHN